MSDEAPSPQRALSPATPASEKRETPSGEPSTGEPASPRSSSSGEPVSKFRRLRRYALEALAVVVIFLVASRYQTRNLVPDGAEAPGLELRALNGDSVSLADFRGKRVLVHFWATWCGVCTQEVGALNATFDALSDDEALVTVVADGDNEAAVRKFVAERGVRYPVLLGNDDAVRAFQVSAFPTNYYVTADGRIDQATVGMSSRFGMQARLRFTD